MNNEEREAKHGEKMISVDVRFWTDDIADGENMVIPKTGWTHGVVKINRNDSHGIKQSGNPIPFNSLMELPAKIEELLIREGITLRRNSNMRRYIE